jgi:hypothetical protein
MKQELAETETDLYYARAKVRSYGQRIKERIEIIPRNKELFFNFVKWLRSDATTIKSESSHGF